jgi:DNA polymerase-3 subunit beta
MNFIIEKNELSSLTTIVYRAASNKNAIPVLSGLLLEVSLEKGLTMTATDMEIGIKASIPNIEVIEEGSALVNAHYFADFIKLLPDTAIEVKYNKDTARLDIYYGRSSGSINTYRDYDYPDLPLNKLECNFLLPQQILKEALKKTVFAAANSHFRQVFTGVLFDIVEDQVLKIIASDTHRLAYYTYKLENYEAEPFSFIIPIRSVNELLRLLDDSEEKINISIGENNVVFYKDDFILLSRLIEGQYPNYEQVIPESFSTSLNIKTDLLEKTLERAKTMPTDDKLKIQNVRLSFKEKEVIVHSYSEIMGEIEEVLEDIELEGENDLSIVFNTNYFLDVVKIMDNESDQVDIKLSGSLGPALIKNPQKENYIYVLVPLRTNN